MRRSVFAPMAIFLVSLSAASSTAALAGATPEQKCQAAKNTAAGKYAAPLPAGDYKSVIDFHSENIARPSEVASSGCRARAATATLEAGEACDSPLRCPPAARPPEARRRSAT